MRMQPATDAAPTPLATALVLVNLGTPKAPTPRAVRRFLAQFLHDYRVVALTRWLWCPLLHFVILPLRGRRVARKYAAIWMQAGSPLEVHTRALAAAVAERLPTLRVGYAMRYGEPSLQAVLAALRGQGVGRALVLPLYPQYSTTTTASVADVLAQIAQDHAAPQLRMIEQYSIDAGVIAALAASVRAHWQAHGRGEKLLISFHGIPQRLVDAGDPYADQCHATVAALVQALALGQDEYLLGFQSRFGRQAWLQPATDASLRRLAAEGVKRVDVICPGFAVDCLETLEEIALRDAEIFHAAVEHVAVEHAAIEHAAIEHANAKHAPMHTPLRHATVQIESGAAAAALGPRPWLRYISCLNASPAHADALAALVRRELETWQ